jgi:HAD domain in Swiss Army Knife RNA repair proteins
MKVIFLDIDGVLNCKRTHNPRKFPYIVDQKLLARLLKLCETTDAKVVLSSTWRYDPIGLLAAKHFGIPFIDVLPDIQHQPRRDEINSWLRSRSDVTRHVVIDDEDDELDDLPLFQPSSRTGLTEAIARGAANYLDGKTDKDMRCSGIVRLLQNASAILRGHDG